MKKINYAAIELDTMTSDNENSSFYTCGTEYTEAEYGREWDGDVCGYLKNADSFDSDTCEIRPLDSCGFNISNIPSVDAFNFCVLVVDGAPCELYWAEEV